jgi:AmiR/NasT family two-component response regulator
MTAENIAVAPRILVIEDEAIVAADIQDRLETLGYEVAGWGTTGAEALELARSSKPDLVLMDIMLKGPMNGIQAAHLVRVELSLPVIFLTANSDEAVLEQAKISEPFAYLLKPFEERQLRTNIEMALYKSRMERERERLMKELQDAIATIKTLSGLLPICAWCKSVRDDSGYWMRVEQYVEAHSQATFSHSVCPECTNRYFGPEAIGAPTGAPGEPPLPPAIQIPPVPPAGS